MRKILNILSGLSLSVSLPLTLVACDKDQDDQEEPIVEPKPDVKPIKKFASFKDFLKANTNFDIGPGDLEYSTHDPKWILYSALADNNFNILNPEYNEPIQTQFKKSLSANLYNYKNYAERLFDNDGSALEKPLVSDFVDANGENIFWNAVKIVEENATPQEPAGRSEMRDFYQTFLPGIWSEDVSGWSMESLIWTYDDEIAAQTFYDSHYIKFEVFESSILWDLKPDNEKGTEVIYWGSEEGVVDLKPYENTCDMPWLKDEDPCQVK